MGGCPKGAAMGAKTGDRRLALGAAAVVSAATAAELLPIRDAEARQWLRDRDLVRELLGRPVVRWGDVLDALEAEPELNALRLERRPLLPL